MGVSQLNRLLLAVVLSLPTTVLSVAAQSKPPTSPPTTLGSQQNSSSPAESKIRLRRVSPVTAGKSPETKPAETAPQPATRSTEGSPAKREVTQPDETLTATDRAIAALRDQIDAAPNAQERVRLEIKLADQLVAAGRKQDAINELHSLTAEDRFDPQGFYNVGNALAHLGDVNGAISAYGKAISQRKGRYSRALNNLGVVLLREGRWDEAYNAFLEALKLENFRYAEASYNLGRLYAARGETDLAVREWRRALAVDPEHNLAAQAIARAGSEGRIIIVSQPVPNKAIGAKPSKSGPSVASAPKSALAAHPVESNTPAVPRTSNPKLLSVDPVTYTFLQRARDARDRGRNQEAIDSYRNVISRMGGYFPPANLEMSYSLITLKRNDEALVNLQQITSKDGSRYPLSYYHLARLYELKGELKLAEEAYAQAAAFYTKKSPQFLLDVSRVREKQGDYQGALAATEEYVSTMQQKGQKPDWSEERLTSLRQKLASSQPKQ